MNVAEIDGYGEKLEFAVERSNNQATANQNRCNEMNKNLPLSECTGTTKVSSIIRDLIQKGGGNAFHYLHQIDWDMEPEEARYEVLLECIVPDGWNEPLTNCEDVCVDFTKDALECEFYVQIADKGKS